MPKTYDIGDQIEFKGTFRNSLGALADPTTVAFKLKVPPLGVESSNTPTKVSVGIYTYNYTILASGKHYYRFVGTGAVVAAGENNFDVRQSAFTTP